MTMALDIIRRPSPNFNSRHGASIDCIVIHTEADAAESTLSWFESKASRVSAHYLIGRDGAVFRCVDDEARAWHAGDCWAVGKM
jgi:N-acetylmuramoyl-L-alanine amidase